MKETRLAFRMKEKTDRLRVFKYEFLHNKLILCSARSELCSFLVNHKKYNFVDYDWFKKLLFFTNSLAKFLSYSLLLDSLLS